MIFPLWLVITVSAVVRACCSAGWAAAVLPWCWAVCAVELSTQLWLGLCCTGCAVCHSPRGHSLTHCCCLHVRQCRHTCRQIGLLKIHFTNHPFQLPGWEQSFCPAALDNENPISNKLNLLLCCPPGKLLTCALGPRCPAPPLCPTWGSAHELASCPEPLETAPTGKSRRGQSP